MRAIVYHREGGREGEDGGTGRRVRFLLFGVQASYLEALRDTFGEDRLLLADASDAGTQADHDTGTGGKVKKAGDPTHNSTCKPPCCCAHCFVSHASGSLGPAHRFAHTRFTPSLVHSPPVRGSVASMLQLQYCDLLLETWDSSFLAMAAHGFEVPTVHIRHVDSLFDPVITLPHCGLRCPLMGGTKMTMNDCRNVRRHAENKDRIDGATVYESIFLRETWGLKGVLAQRKFALARSMNDIRALLGSSTTSKGGDGALHGGEVRDASSGNENVVTSNVTAPTTAAPLLSAEPPQLLAAALVGPFRLQFHPSIPVAQYVCGGNLPAIGGRTSTSVMGRSDQFGNGNGGGGASASIGMTYVNNENNHDKTSGTSQATRLTRSPEHIQWVIKANSVRVMHRAVNELCSYLNATEHWSSRDFVERAGKMHAHVDTKCSGLMSTSEGEGEHDSDDDDDNARNNNSSDGGSDTKETGGNTFYDWQMGMCDSSCSIIFQLHQHHRMPIKVDGHNVSITWGADDDHHSIAAEFCYNEGLNSDKAAQCMASGRCEAVSDQHCATALCLAMIKWQQEHSPNGPVFDSSIVAKICHTLQPSPQSPSVPPFTESTVPLSLDTTSYTTVSAAGNKVTKPCALQPSETGGVLKPIGYDSPFALQCVPRFTFPSSTGHEQWILGSRLGIEAYSHGYFVELGLSTTTPLSSGSNTEVMESHFGFTGICFPTNRDGRDSGGVNVGKRVRPCVHEVTSPQHTTSLEGLCELSRLWAGYTTTTAGKVWYEQVILRSLFVALGVPLTGQVIIHVHTHTLHTHL